MDKLADVIGRLDRLRFPSDISFHRGGKAHRRRDPAGRPRRRTRATRAASGAIELDGGGDPTDARAERRLIRRAIRRSTTGSPSPPTARSSGKADLFHPRERRGEAARRHSRARSRICAGPATASRSSCSPPTAASTAARPTARCASGGAARRIRPSTNPTDARRRLFKVDGGRRQDRRRSARAMRTRLGVRPARRRRRDGAGLRRRQRARLVSFARSPSSISATRTTKVLHRSHWQLQGPAASPSGKRVAFLEGWSSDRGLVAGEMRILDLATGKVTSLAPAEAIQHHVLVLARRGEPVVRRLVAARLDLRHRAARRHVRVDRARGRRHRPEQLPRRDLAGAGQQGLCRHPRSRRRAAGDRVQGLAARRTGRRSPR